MYRIIFVLIFSLSTLVSAHVTDCREEVVIVDTVVEDTVVQSKPDEPTKPERHVPITINCTY